MKLRERRSAFILSNVLHNTFRLLWVLWVFWYELGTYYASLSSCKWPYLPSDGQKPSHVLLLSDTQVIHTPYALLAGLSLAWRRFLSDLNLRKNWHVTSRLRPHAVVFLGDMLASGTTLKNLDEYDRGVRHFKSIFTLPDIPMYYVPGNTDISLGKASKHAKELKNFYIQSFGPLNHVFSIRNHTFVGLDAPGLVDEDYQRAAQGREYGDWNVLPGGAVSFVRSVYTDEEPVILLSHIPLSRPSAASCGLLREKGKIRRNVGDGFQSLLGKQTTQFLLDTLRPSLIFSGDNRDYCEFTHTFAVSEDDELKQKTVREVTVKSFSMSKHIRRPGFQLLSLVNPSSSNATSFADSLCLLPDQGRIYSTIYPALLVMTLLVLFIFNKTKLGRHRKNQLAPLSVLSAPSSGYQTPTHYAESDAWSTRTTNTYLSPRNSTQLLSPLLNLSNGPKLRIPSCPGTPNGSPPHRYIAHPGETDEEEAMYPVYSPHQFSDHELRNNEEWSSRHENEGPLDGNTQWASTPGWKPVTASKPLWSWAFVFRGRRRRMTLAIPSWDDLNTLYEMCQGHFGHTRRKGIVVSTILDFGSVLWPALLTWTFITWYHF